MGSAIVVDGGRRGPWKTTSNRDDRSEWARGWLVRNPCSWGRGITFPGSPDMTRIEMSWLGVHPSRKSAIFGLPAVEK